MSDTPNVDVDGHRAGWRLGIIRSSARQGSPPIVAEPFLSHHVRNRRVPVVVLRLWQDKIAVASQRRLESWRLK